MQNFIKIQGKYKNIQTIFKKSGGIFIESYDSIDNILSDVYTYAGNIDDIRLLCSNSIIGETAQLRLVINNEIISDNVIWEITSGSGYATINSSGLLTILSNANESIITVTATYNGLRTSKNIVITYKEGSTQLSNVVQNDDGTIIETITITNSDGSSSQITNNYDEDGYITGTENKTTDTSGNVSTQDISYDSNGDAIITGYSIDTTNNDNGGLSTSSTDGISTGIIPFDGTGMTIIHLKTKINISNLSPSHQGYVISSYVSENSVVSGFGLYFNASSSHLLYGFFGDGNGNMEWMNLKNGSGTSTNSSNTYYTPSSGEHVYDITITQNSSSIWSFVILVDSTQIYSGTTNTSLSSNDLQVSVGQRIAPNGKKAGFCPMEIIEFEVIKTLS